MASLQDQLLKKGLINDKKAKQAKKDKNKNDKMARKHKVFETDENKEAIEKARADKTARDRMLNQQREEAARKKAIVAQIKQLIQMNKIEKNGGDISYKFNDGKIKTVYLNEEQHSQLSNGLLAIVRLNHTEPAEYEIVPAVVAEKIAQRDKAAVVLLNKKNQQANDKDDPYADFKVPDDLMW